jgi:phosphohistidine phosphatase SixA
VVLSGMEQRLTESQMPFTPGERLFYAAFACNGCGRCRAEPSVTSFTVPGENGGDGGLDGGPADGGSFDGGHLPSDAGVLTPAAFSAVISADGQRVQLSWQNVNNPNLTSVRVLRAATFAGVTQAPEVVFEGLETSTSERVDQLLPTTTTVARSYLYQVVGCSRGRCETAGPTAPLTLTLKQALRGGGYTIFWRHASADVCADQTSLCPTGLPAGQTCAQALSGTVNADWWKTCTADPPACTTTARQLNAALASNETMAVRTWFQSNGVSVSRVLTSEYCRCFATAQGFAFGPMLEYSSDLTFFVYDEATRCPRTLALLNQAPDAGTNTAMVSHAGFVCPTLDSLAWAEAAIYRPQAPSTQTCTGIAGCASDEACVSGRCVKPLFIARVPALGAVGWSSLP